MIAFVGLVNYAPSFPELELTENIEELPEPGPTIKVASTTCCRSSCWFGA